MELLPVQFSEKYSRAEYGELQSSQVLDLIQNYLNEQGFPYIKRKKDEISFHVIYTKSFRFKGILFSGVVKASKVNGDLVVMNGNWMVLLSILIIPLIFIIINLISGTESYEIPWFLVITAVIGNFIIRLIGHFIFRQRIRNLVKQVFTPIGKSNQF